MKRARTYGFSILVLIAGFLPVCASAHALPVSSEPASSATVLATPSQVSITFSEHVDKSASAITITGPKGDTVSQGDAVVDQSNARIMSVPMIGEGDGTYLVSWSAVSADDGHFTQGAFAFAVGKGLVANTASTSQGEIVELSTVPETLGSAIELFGNGMLWAALFLMLFAVRPLLRSGAFRSEEPLLERGYRVFVYAALFFAFFGGLWQLLDKSGDLATVRLMPFLSAVPLYIGTAAGAATLWRMGAIVFFAVVFVFANKIIFRSPKVTFYEFALVAIMCVFAFFRAKISHATANPFYPDFSITVNFFHLIEKDVWVGILLALVLLLLSPRLKSFFTALLPRATQMLIVDFAAVAVTATYIVWLHLKSFDNLFTTGWGGAFLELLAAASLMVLLRSYHIFARWRAPEFFTRFLPATLASELAMSIFVVYFSSLVIITSPPIGVGPTRVLSANDQGVSMSITNDADEDGMLMFTSQASHPTEEPTITANSAAGTLSIALQKRFNGGYVFPLALLPSQGPFTLSVTVPQPGSYDAHATFTTEQSDFVPSPDWEAVRPFDSFTFIMILFALGALAWGAVLWFITKQEGSPLFLNSKTAWRATAGFVLGAVIGALATFGASASGIENPFKAQCEGDGNMWHVMQPTKGGVPTSQTPEEGCMWGMGSYMYMFPDSREYDYNRAPAQAEVSLATTSELVAGIPTTFTLSLKNTDGTPAQLFYDMDKLLHVIIISKDESVFAHIHPDDLHPLTPQEINSSTYTLNYTFPKAGTYMIAADYAHGLQLESKQFIVDVAGAPAQSQSTTLYSSSGTFDGYHVNLTSSLLIAGKVENLYFTADKDGKPLTTITPWLDAAAHVSVVKNDFSWYLHVHGEVHPPGQPIPPIIVKNGQVVHTMAMMMNVPAQFGPMIEAHLIFPSSGLYTIWEQFEVNGVVVPASFTVRVED